MLNVDNNSVYAQDHWTISDRLSADLGARYEHVQGGVDRRHRQRRHQPHRAARSAWPTTSTATATTSSTSPTASTPAATTRRRSAPTARSATRPTSSPIYQGPAGQGVDFAPGFDLANYPINAANATVLDPTQNIKMNPNLQSPLVHEFTASYGTRMFGTRGYGEVSYIARVTHDLIEDYQTLEPASPTSRSTGSAPASSPTGST